LAGSSVFPSLLTTSAGTFANATIARLTASQYELFEHSAGTTEANRNQVRLLDSIASNSAELAEPVT